MNNSQKQYFVDQLTDEQKQLICQAINTYGDGQHPIAMVNSLHLFNPVYIVHCLGKQHWSVIGTHFMNELPENHDQKKLNLNEMHDEVMQAVTDAIEFGV